MNYKYISIKLNMLLSPPIGYLARIFYKYKYKNPPIFGKYIYINPKQIVYWYNKVSYREFVFEGQVVGGDWEDRMRDAEIVFKTSLKYNGIIDHFVHSIPWNKTSYKEKITKNIRSKEKAEKKFKRQCKKIDELFYDIKERGFKTNEDDPKIEDIFVHIYKEGQIVYTAGGNHRLAIAIALGIEKMPVRVYRRHKEWMKIREEYLDADNSLSVNLDKYKNHPDLI